MAKDVHPSLLVFLLDDRVRGVRAVYEKLDQEDLYRAGARAEPMAYGDEAEKRAAKLKGYLFKTVDPSLAVGDLVVVPTDTRHGFTVCKIVEVDVEPDMTLTTEVKWIVNKIDVSNYFDVLESEKSIKQKVADRALAEQRRKLKETLLGDFEGAAGMTLALSLDADIAEAQVIHEPPAKPNSTT